eukprot:jgi/Psemu1/321876/estExt_fgenesh1_pg.C_120039
MPIKSNTNGRSRIPHGPNTSPKIKVLVCTANIGNEEPNDESIGEWIPKDGATKLVLQNQQYPVKADNVKTITAEPSLHNGRNHDKNGEIDDEQFDIIAIGMQEATFDLRESSKTSLGITFQKVAHAVEQATKNENYNYNEDTEQDHFDDGRGRDDTRYFHQTLGNHLPSYARAVSYQRGQMRLMVFYIKDKISLDVLSVKAQNTGRAGLANKGGIVAECDVNQGTTISFLTAHLEAHEGLAKYNTRCSTIGDIFRGTSSSVADYVCDVSMTSHFMFAMGDLNFRTRLPNYEIGSEEHLKEAHRLAKTEDWETLNKHDELSLALSEKECLVGFSTPLCDFPPTFKVERKDGYTYISKRSPSYTDRILYKANHLLSQMVNILAYEPIDHFTTSDHKPIRGAFEIQLNQKLKLEPIKNKKKGKERLAASTSAFRRKVATILGRKPGASGGESGKVFCENFHIFISSIRCNINKEACSALTQMTQMPSLRVSFIATPTDAMKLEGATKSLNSFHKQSSDRPSKLLKASVSFKHTTNWPCTQPIPNGFNPRWKDEIHFKIRTHLMCGTPVDLTGAMLHILVHDTKDHMNLIGLCSFNLASLIMSSVEEQYLNNDESDSCQPETINASESLAFESTRRRFCNEMLTKNGKEVGMIKFNVDTWWLNDAKFQGLSERKRSSRKKKASSSSILRFWS